MKQVYPAIFTPDNGQYLVSIPDFDIMTQGDDLIDAIEMARDAVQLMGIQMEDDGKALPPASDAQDITLEPEQFISLIDCDFDAYRRALDNRSVKKNCTLPSWLNRKAELAHINFSAVLQEALIEKLGGGGEPPLADAYHARPADGLIEEVRPHLR